MTWLDVIVVLHGMCGVRCMVEKLCIKMCISGLVYNAAASHVKRLWCCASCSKSWCKLRFKVFWWLLTQLVVDCSSRTFLQRSVSTNIVSNTICKILLKNRYRYGIRSQDGKFLLVSLHLSSKSYIVPRHCYPKTLLTTVPSLTIGYV